MRQNGQNKFLTVAGPQIYWNLCQYNLAQFARSGCIPRFQDLLDKRTKDPCQVNNTCCTWGCLASRWWKEGTSDPWHFHTLTHSTWDCYLSTPESNKKSNIISESHGLDLCLDTFRQVLTPLGWSQPGLGLDTFNHHGLGISVLVSILRL